MLHSISTTRAPNLDTDPGRSAETEWSKWISRPPGIRPSRRIGRVLLVAYQFPPTGGSGVYRPTALSRWLPSSGWEVEVLTAGHGRFPWHDDSLLEEVPAACPVHRVRGWEPACVAEMLTWSAYPGGTDAQGMSHDDSGERGRQGGRLRRQLQDRVYWRLLAASERMGLGHGESLWVRSAVRCAVRRHRRGGFDAVISTGPPHVTHEAARRISRRLRIPWMADLRDPLISDFDRQKADRNAQERLLRLEQTVLNEAGLIVTTCPSLAETWRSRYPHRGADIIAITNGFNRDQIATVADGIASGHRDTCRLVTAGAFYGRREIARLIEPLEEVLKWRPEWRERVRLVIAGTIDADQRRRWERRLPKWVELTGYVDRITALRLTATAACNILMVPECEHGRLSIPGKTFDLLALPVHLLALTPRGSDTERIVEAAGAATCVEMEAMARVSAAMERIVADFFDSRLKARRDWRQLDRYDQEEMALRFAASLSELTARVTTSDAVQAGRPAAAGVI